MPIPWLINAENVLFCLQCDENGGKNVPTNCAAMTDRWRRKCLIGVENTRSKTPFNCVCFYRRRHRNRNARGANAISAESAAAVSTPPHRRGRSPPTPIARFVIAYFTSTTVARRWFSNRPDAQLSGFFSCVCVFFNQIVVFLVFFFFLYSTVIHRNSWV